ncbi:MAG: isoprenylcysteine carboxylmethyltransferase family protein [Candidatus Dormibacteria bacterium]
MLFLAGCGLDLLGPVLVLTGRLDPVGGVDIMPMHAAGLVVFALALPVTIIAQRDLGGAWRTGIDPTTAAPLVTTGVFTVVRNPIYTIMVATSLGVALLVPTIVSPLALAGCLIAIEVQTRRVEEPFLEQRHGGSYRSYASRVGRFVPVLGRLQTPW